MKKQNQNQNIRKKQTEHKTPSRNVQTTVAQGKSHISPTQWLLLLLVVVATAVAYLPAINNDFTNWDDNGYVLENDAVKSLSVENTKTLFSRYDMGNYHPITMLSLAIDYSLSEMIPAEKYGEAPLPSPRMFHITNLLLHLANTIAVFFMIYLLLGQCGGAQRVPLVKGLDYPFFVAGVSALLFGLNTIHVESVAWVSERKDVLYTFFYLMSIIVYLLYTRKRKAGWLVLSVLLFVLSGLSKGQAVSLAVSLLAVDYLLGRKLTSRTVMLEKVPYFVVALVVGIVAIKAQEHGEAIHDINEYPFYLRIVFASYSYVQYLVKMVAPESLAAMYPYPHPADGGVPSYFYVFPLVVGALLFGVYLLFRKNDKALIFGFLFYSVNIFLLLQLLPVGSAIMADRYAYVPSIGFFVLTALLLYRLAAKTNTMATLAVLLVLSGYWGAKTYAQTQVWKDSLTLWNSTLAESPRAVVAWNNRGSAKDKLDDKAGAIADFTEAVTLKPDYTHAFYNRGTALKDIFRYQEAVEDFNRALAIDPKFTEAYHNRGIARENLNDLKGAIEDYNMAIQLREQANLYANRGVAKGKMGFFDEAIEDFNISIRLKTDNPEAYSNRGFAKVNKKDFAGGIADYDIALAQNPKASEPRYNRAIAYQQIGDTIKALADYDILLNENPTHTDGLRNRAYINFVRRNWPAAIADYSLMLKADPTTPEIYNSRANAYYNSAKWAEAIADYQEVIKLVPNYGQAYVNMGLAHVSMGNKAQGCEALQKAVQMNVPGAAASLRQYCK